MRFRSIAVLALLLTLPLTAQGQKQTASTKEVRESLRASKKTLVTENMRLTESEAETFWPLYQEFQTELEAIGDRELKLIENYGRTHKVMTNDSAGMILNKYLDIQSDKIELQKKYVARFNKVIPMTKVLRYYQLENKFRLAVDSDITSKIPLAEQQ